MDARSDGVCLAVPPERQMNHTSLAALPEIPSRREVRVLFLSQNINPLRESLSKQIGSTA